MRSRHPHVTASSPVHECIRNIIRAQGGTLILPIWRVPSTCAYGGKSRRASPRRRWQYIYARLLAQCGRSQPVSYEGGRHARMTLTCPSALICGYLVGQHLHAYTHANYHLPNSNH